MSRAKFLNGEMKIRAYSQGETGQEDVQSIHRNRREVEYMGIDTSRQVNVVVRIHRRPYLIIFSKEQLVFSIQQEAKSSSEHEDGRTGTKGLRAEQLIEQSARSVGSECNRGNMALYPFSIKGFCEVDSHELNVRPFNVIMCFLWPCPAVEVASIISSWKI